MEEQIKYLKDTYGDLAINVARDIVSELKKVDTSVNSYHLTEAIIYWKQIIKLIEE